jgi:putative membrane protein
MVEDHQKTIAEFKAEADAGSGAVAGMAKAQLPTLEKHLTTAQSLQKQAGQ